MESQVKDLQIHSIGPLKKPGSLYTAMKYLDFSPKLIKPKFNSIQGEYWSEILTDKVMSKWRVPVRTSSIVEKIGEALSSTSIWDLFRSSLEHIIRQSYASPQKAEKHIAGYIRLQSEGRERLSERIREELKKSYIPTRFSESQSDLNDSDFIENINKPYELCRSQVKNLIKRLLIWSNQKPRKAVSTVQTLIKFIITPRLFGIYVTEEDNNRLAVSFSNC